MGEKIYLEDFEEGDSTITPGRTVTEADIVNFASLSGDWNELHTNKEYMKDSKFGQRIGHGLLTISIASGLNARSEFSPKIVAFLGMDELRFLNPVFIGDTIKVKSEIIEVRPSESKEGVGVLRAEDTVKNQRDEDVATWKKALLVEKKK